MLKRWRILFPALTVGAIAIACGPGFLDGISGGQVDAGGEPRASDSGPVCNSLVAPDKPPGLDPTETVTLPTFAINRLRIDTNGSPDAGGPPPVGLNLDNQCTCPGPDSCLKPDGSPTSSCDRDGGTDNALATLFNQLNSGIPAFPQTFLTDRIHTGNFSILLEVNGWNGGPNDSQVAVTMRDAPGIDRFNPDGGRETPLFDGRDLWTVDSESINGGDEAVGTECVASPLPCIAKIRDDLAYVSNGTLVAHPRNEGLEPVPIRLRSALGEIDLEFYGFTITAHIDGPPGGPYTIEGELVGRLAASNVLTTFAYLDDFSKTGKPPPPICANPSLFAAARAATCAASDLAIAGKDNTNTPCSFLSAALSFGASQAVAGTVKGASTSTLPCDGSTYTCD